MLTMRIVGYAHYRFDKIIDKIIEGLAPNTAKIILELRFQKSFAKLYKKNFEHVLWYWREYRFLDEIEKIVGFKNKTVLDLGCGLATLLNHIDAKEKCGVDPLAEEYKRFYHYPKDVQLKVGYGERIPFPENKFDVVVCTNALDHTDKPSATLDEINRVLKPTGTFILSVELRLPNTKINAAHPNNITHKELQKLLQPHFTVLFHKKSQFVGFMKYMQGERRAKSYEHILVCKKVKSKPTHSEE